MRHDNTIKYRPYIPYKLFKMGYNKKGCAKIYRILMDFNHNIGAEIQKNWEDILYEDLTIQRIERSFRNLHNMEEGSYIKYIQFKMLHRRIVTYKRLCDMGIKEKSSSHYCPEAKETLEHAFIYCNAAKDIWKEVENWLKHMLIDI